MIADFQAIDIKDVLYRVGIVSYSKRATRYRVYGGNRAGCECKCITGDRVLQRTICTSI